MVVTARDYPEVQLAPRRAYRVRARTDEMDVRSRSCAPGAKTWRSKSWHTGSTTSGYLARRDYFIRNFISDLDFL